MAYRDAELTLRSQFRAAFADRVRRLISLELQDTDFLKQLILSVVGRTVSGMGEDRLVDVLIPKTLFSPDEKEQTLTDEGQEHLRHLVLGITGEMLREGVKLKLSGDMTAGIRIRQTDENVELDLTDEALSDLILKHLLPRYRAIVSGAQS
jgi:V/A-type H+-transporting ATPase subunit E